MSKSYQKYFAIAKKEDADDRSVASEDGLPRLVKVYHYNYDDLESDLEEDVQVEPHVPAVAVSK